MTSFLVWFPRCGPRFCLLSGPLLFFATLLHASALTVHSDAECALFVDGKLQGSLKPGSTLDLKLPPGNHRLEAVAAAGNARWQQNIDLSADGSRRDVRVAFSSSDVSWHDPETRLTWTLSDNGSGLSWSQAFRYCAELTSGGFNDWALPSIDDLQQLFDPSRDQAGYHIKGPLKLTGWQWSSTAGTQKGEGWAFDFGDGGRASVDAGDSGLNRALCVRKQDK